TCRTFVNLILRVRVICEPRTVRAPVESIDSTDPLRGSARQYNSCMFDKSNALFPIKDRYIFLTHCGIAPLYSGAMRAEHEVAEEQCRTGALVYGRYDAILDGLRDAAAQVLRTHADNLAFVKNTSEGINLIANGYPFQPGDQIISYIHEYPANHYPW